MNKIDTVKSESPHEARPSRATVGRFSLYLRRLQEFLQNGDQTVSSTRLGKALGVTDAQVRKDLAYLDIAGRSGVGYGIAELITALRETLGLHRQWSVAVVGVGNLARALLRYRGFGTQGFRFVALFDSDPTKIGREIDGLEVFSPDAMSDIIPKSGAELGLLTVPAEMAQQTADALVKAGIRGILNFAPTVIRTPEGVSLANVDLAIQLEQLAFLVHLS